jgi:hypothetical protein
LRTCFSGAGSKREYRKSLANAICGRQPVFESLVTHSITKFRHLCRASSPAFIRQEQSLLCSMMKPNPQTAAEHSS